MTFGERLKALREKAGLSQLQLAEKSGIAQRSISHYENGVTPGWNTIVALADALGVPTDAFRGGLGDGRAAVRDAEAVAAV